MVYTQKVSMQELVEEAWHYATKFLYNTNRTRTVRTYTHSPNLSSPKFPHPIFFPTRKLGPTISTPACPVEEVEVLIPLVLLLVLGRETLRGSIFLLFIQK